MWILFGNKTRVRPVPGGQTVERHCDDGNEVRRLVGGDVADKVSLFFVPLFDMKTRRLVCRECGDDVEVRGGGEGRPPSAAQPPPAARKPSPPPRASDKD